MDENEKVNFTVEEHTTDLLAQRIGAGWYYSFDGIVKTGPFEDKDTAQAAAVEAVEKSVADVLSAALFGEAA